MSEQSVQSPPLSEATAKKAAFQEHKAKVEERTTQINKAAYGNPDVGDFLDSRDKHQEALQIIARDQGYTSEEEKKIGLVRRVLNKLKSHK